MKILKVGFIVWVFIMLMSNLQGYSDRDSNYIIPDIPYIPDPVAIAKQDSIVRRAFIKKDTTPYKGHWIDINR